VSTKRLVGLRREPLEVADRWLGCEHREQLLQLVLARWMAMRCEDLPMSSGSSSVDMLGEAWSSFACGEWEAARAVFERALRSGPSGRALDGLGQTAFWLGEEAARGGAARQGVSPVRAEGEREMAANVAVFLAGIYRIYGNASLASGWLGRAERLLEQSGDLLRTGSCVVAADDMAPPGRVVGWQRRAARAPIHR
jgi:hypothetical protein